MVARLRREIVDHRRHCGSAGPDWDVTCLAATTGSGA